MSPKEERTEADQISLEEAERTAKAVAQRMLTTRKKPSGPQKRNTEIQTTPRHRKRED